MSRGSSPSLSSQQSNLNYQQPSASSSKLQPVQSHGQLSSNSSQWQSRRSHGQPTSSNSLYQYSKDNVGRPIGTNSTSWQDNRRSVNWQPNINQSSWGGSQSSMDFQSPLNHHNAMRVGPNSSSLYERFVRAAKLRPIYIYNHYESRSKINGR